MTRFVPVTPAAFPEWSLEAGMEAAQGIIDAMKTVDPDQLPLSIRDAANASLDAQRQLMGRLSTFSEFNPDHKVSITRGNSALLAQTFVFLLMLHRARERCQHIKWPASLMNGQRLIFQASTGTAGCERCYTEVVARFYDDGHCEVCEQPADTFYPASLPVGAVLLTVNMCSGCRAALLA